MPTPTYTLISETVLSSAQASVTFSSIPGTFKDLVVECVTRSNRADNVDLLGIRFNLDTGTNYSTTELSGDGGAAGSGRTSNATYIFGRIDANISPSGSWSIVNFNVFSYVSTTNFKTVLDRENTSGYAGAIVGTWRSTSAITRIDLLPILGTTLNSGSTFRLWGVVG